LWSNGGTTSSISFIYSGTYTVTVTNLALSCSFPIILTVDEIFNYNVVSNSEFACASNGSATLNIPNSSNYIYSWSSGDSTQTAYNLSAGTYTVTAVNSSIGCAIIDTVIVSYNPNTNVLSDICIVSVDSSDGKNLVIWEKPSNQGINYFKIYKQNSLTSQYDSIGFVPIDSFSVFKDMNSNPSQQSASYKISVVDSCGVEWNNITQHTTIHLSANQGVNNNVNLQWNAYSGFSYPNFEIYRSNNGGAYALIGTVANNSFSYTDLTPPLGTNYYYVAVTKTTPCNPTKSAPVLKSISNVLDGNGNPVNVDMSQFAQFSVYPNPTENYVIVSHNENIGTVRVVITDMLGKIVKTETIDANKQFIVSMPEVAGLYNLLLISDKGNTQSTIVVKK
jgi:hypothetical protein